MSIDAVLKRYFWLVLGLLVAIAAYFQASGLGQLVAATLGGGEPPRAASTRSAPVVASKPERSASAILSRNPFDSVTGPLDGTPFELRPLPESEVKNANDPYEDPVCDGASVSIIMASADPEWSFASISSSEGSQLRRRGDEVGGKRVHHIGWFQSAPDAMPRVWLEGGGPRCIVDRGGAQPAGKPAAKPAATPKVTGPGADLASKITKISDTEFIVERSAVDAVLENPMSFAGSLRTRPTDKGVRLSGIHGSSLFGMLGLRSGDMLQSINGFQMTDPEKALEALAKLRTSPKLTIAVERAGQPKNIDVTIR